ncbi:hypothetical protein FQN52_004449 [Onygenales sp. PD_12]|nr:hypothetical protein FQN52_004449 [Onygenales sp. PD_12]
MWQIEAITAIVYVFIVAFTVLDVRNRTFIDQVFIALSRRSSSSHQLLPLVELSNINPASPSRCHGESSESTASISPIPAFYIYRPNGAAVPLVPLDELPSWLRIGAENWYDAEWRRYMRLASEQPVMKVGEYDVFARVGSDTYMMPRGIQIEDTDTGSRKVTYHLQRSYEDGGETPGNLSDDDARWLRLFSPSIFEADSYRNDIEDQEVVTAPPPSPDRATHPVTFSYFDLPIRTFDRSSHQGHECSPSPPPQTPLGGNDDLSRTCSNGSGSRFFSSATDITTPPSTPFSVASNFGGNYFPILPSLPVGMAQSAPPDLEAGAYEQPSEEVYSRIRGSSCD